MTVFINRGEMTTGPEGDRSTLPLGSEGTGQVIGAV